MWSKNKAEIQDFILIKVNDNMWIWKNSLPYRWISPISTEVIGNPQRFLKLVGEHWIRYIGCFCILREPPEKINYLL